MNTTRLREEFMSATDIEAHPIHLGRSATAEVEPEFTGALSWYGDSSLRLAAALVCGRIG